MVAFNRGAVSEIVDHGVTGFVVENESEAAAAIGQIHTVSREMVRFNFQDRFTARRMALDYLNVYRNMAFESRLPDQSAESRRRPTAARNIPAWFQTRHWRAQPR